MKLSDAKYLQPAVREAEAATQRRSRSLPRVAVQDPAGTRIFGWLQSDDGETACVFVDDLTVYRVPSYSITRLGRSESVREVKELREAIRAEMSRRADLKIQALDEVEEGLYKATLTFSANLGDPDEASLLALLATRISHPIRIADAAVNGRGRLVAVVRETDDGLVSAAEAAKAVELGDPKRLGDWIEMPVKFDAEVFAKDGAPQITSVIKHCIEHHVSHRGNGSYGLTGPVHIEMGDVKGTAIARFQATQPGPFPSAVVED